MPNDALAKRIRDARKRRGMNQTAFAAAIGVSRDTVWRLEKGENVHKDHALSALRLLGLDEPGLTSDAETSPERQALARALLRAYDSSPAMAATLDAIARPHLDARGTPGRASAPQLDAAESGDESRAPRKTSRRQR